PCFGAGGGVANSKQTFTVVYDFLPLSATELTALGLTISPIPTRPITQSYTESTTDLALMLGGGISILKGDHLSFDVDLRYLHLLEYRNRDIGRFGAGVSYRF